MYIYLYTYIDQVKFTLVNARTLCFVNIKGCVCVCVSILRDLFSRMVVIRFNKGC